MRENIKKYARKIVATILVMSVMLVSSSQQIEFVKATDSNYKEMSIADWGTLKETSGDLNVYRLTDSNAISSLDGVAINATLNFNGATWNQIAFGGTDSAPIGGFWMVYSGGSWLMGSNHIGATLEWKSLDSATSAYGNQEVQLRMTFDKATSTNNWTVNVYANDDNVGTFTYEGVTPGLYIAIHKNVTFTAPKSSESQVYAEMEFDDWGVSEGSLYGVDIYSLTNTSAITSLDKVALSGKVNFNGDAGAYFRIGGYKNAGSDMRHAGFRIGTVDGALGIWPQAIGGSEANQVIVPAAQWATLINTEIILRMEFDKNTTTSVWTVTIYINNDKKGSYNCGQTTPGLYLGNVGVTLKGLENEPAYTEMTFGDWGISEGPLYGVDIYSLTQKDAITSLDRVAVSGKVNFNGDAGAYFRIGGYKNAGSDLRHAGFRLGTVNGALGIWPQAIGGNEANQLVLDVAQWETLINTEFTLRMEFDKDARTSNWSVTIYIGENKKGSYNCGQATPGLYIGNVGVSIENLGAGEAIEIPDIYNPPTEMGGETFAGNYITDVSVGEKTTVISAADTDNGYVSSTDYNKYGLDYVMDWNVEREIKVLQLTDTQTIDSAQSRTANRLPFQSQIDEWAPEEMYNNLFRYIIKTVNDAKPDLILITGDVIYGEFDDNGTSLLALIQCMDSLKIPWAPIFGNHENESNMGVKWQCEQFEASPYCLFERRNEIGGNGNYSIGIAKNGALKRVIYMMDNNGCAYSSDYNGTEVKTSFGFTEKQKEWYKNTASTVNTVAGSKIPSFLCYHAPTLEMQEAVVAAGYQSAGSKDTYTLGTDIANVQAGDSGTKGGKAVYTYDEDGLLEIMKAVGTDGAFFGHEHLNNLSVAYKGIRWTYGLKTGTYDSTPNEVGGTLITLSASSDLFTVTQVKTARAEIDASYPRMNYILPKAPKNPNEGIKPKEYKELKFTDWGVQEGNVERAGYAINLYSLTKKKSLASLDGVAISGKVNFNGNGWQWLNFGGTEGAKDGGFWLSAVGENGWAMACQAIGTNYNDEIKWSTAAKFEEEVELRMTFDKGKASNTWTVSVYADDVKVGSRIYEGVNPGLYIGIPQGITIAGMKNTKPTVTLPKFSKKYKEMHFSDFGIYNGVVEDTDIYSLKSYDNISSLDGVAISGKVNFNCTKDGMLRIGGTEGLKHAGFWLFTDGENLRLSPQGIGDEVIDHFLLGKEAWQPLMDKEITLRLTFNKEKNTGKWWVGIYINGQNIGLYNCGVATPGLYLGIYSNVKVRGLVKDSKLDFSLFGYTNKNWREEMGLK